MTSTSGQRAAMALQAAPAAPSTAAQNLSTCLPMEVFSIPFNGHLISFEPGIRKKCEQPLKAAIIAAGKDVVWES